MRFLVSILALLALLLHVVPAQAAEAEPPGQKPGHYVRWSYPSQMTYGPIEDGQGKTGTAPSAAAFLTLPFMGPHYITSLFDHCSPDYGINGKTCRYDGTVVSAGVGSSDPTFSAGYAQTPGGHDYLYYDGHDGYDYGLYYEPVAAAAPGVVILSGWVVPSCHTCLSGLTIEINHGNNLRTYYGHLSRIDVVNGQHVQRGQVIGISGMTGTATGPHLHFGVYYVNRSLSPVDPYGWSGSYPDPWPLDLGDLWISGSPRFADVPLPSVSANAELDPNNANSIDVSWSSTGGGNRFRVDTVQQDGQMKSWLVGVGAGTAVFQGRPGQSYWFWVSVTTNLGWTDSGGSPLVSVPVVNHGEVQ